jgi:hypothetical protein
MCCSTISPFLLLFSDPDTSGLSELCASALRRLSFSPFRNYLRAILRKIYRAHDPMWVVIFIEPYP